MTDVVFPGFLFIVGVSIPLALAKRKTEARTSVSLLGHVLLRTLTLLFLGVLHVNLWQWLWPFWETGGLPGILNAAVMTAFILLLTTLATRAKLVLKL
jgi:predicted acyltransferase